MFSIKCHQIESIFNNQSITSKESFAKVKSWQGIKGLQEILHTSAQNGLNDSMDIKKQRISCYGQHRRKCPKQKDLVGQIFEYIWEDQVGSLLGIVGIIALITGLIVKGFPIGLLDGSAVLLAILIYAFVTKVASSHKRTNLKKLKYQANLKTVHLLRNSEIKQYRQQQILVGDIMILQKGQKLSVDGILIQGDHITMDQSSVTGEFQQQKYTYEQVEADKNKKDCFLFSGSWVREGHGKMLVMAVGPNSSQAIVSLKLQGADDLQEQTLIESKFQILLHSIGGVFLKGTVLATVFILLHVLYQKIVDKNLLTLETLHEIIMIIAFCLGFAFNGIPQFASKAGTNLIAYNIKSLEQDKVLIRKMQSIESLGLVTDIVINEKCIGADDNERIEQIKHFVQICETAGIKVRLLSQLDHESTTLLANQLNLIRQLQAAANQFPQIVTAAKFRQFISQQPTYDEQQNQQQQLMQQFDQNLVDQFNDEQIKDMKRLRKFSEGLKVLRGFTAKDKSVFFDGLKRMKRSVAYVGIEENDSSMLKKADVGIAISTAEQTAKQVSGIILLDDSFTSILQGIKWGRYLRDSVQKYLQFLIIMNLSFLIVVLVSTLIFGQSPFSILQFVWINLIMDTLGSLILMTEKPNDEVLKSEYKPTEKFVSAQMWQNIIVFGICQLIVLIALLFISNLDFISEPKKQVETHYSIFFNFFIWIQLFTLLHFRTFKHSNIHDFLGENTLSRKVFIGIVLTQFLMIQFGGRIFMTVPLSFDRHLACAFVAAVSVIVAKLLKTVLHSRTFKVYEQLEKKGFNLF